MWCLNNGFDGTLQIDRIDNNGNYEPSNCRLVSQTTNMRNTSRVKYIEWRGEKKCLSEWAEILNIKYYTLQYRLKKGWDIERVFTEKSK
jgi:hypothetical protein